MGALFDKPISAAQYGRKEKGEDGWQYVEEFAKILDALNIDPRFILDKLDDIRTADLLLTKEIPLAEQLKRIEQAVESKIPASKRDDPEAQLLNQRPSIRGLVARLRRCDDIKIAKLESYLDGLEDREDQERAHRAAN